MLSNQTTERLRELSVSERLRMTLRMIDEGMPLLTRGTPDQVRRRFELLRTENDARNRGMLSALSKSP